MNGMTSTDIRISVVETSWGHFKVKASTIVKGGRVVEAHSSSNQSGSLPLADLIERAVEGVAELVADYLRYEATPEVPS